MLHYTNAEQFYQVQLHQFTYSDIIKVYFLCAVYHLKSLWMLYSGRQRCQVKAMVVIFTFRLKSGIETERKRTRCSCVKGRRREVAKQGKNWMVGWKVSERERGRGGNRRDGEGNNETIK